MVLTQICLTQNTSFQGEKLLTISRVLIHKETQTSAYQKSNINDRVELTQTTLCIKISHESGTD